MTFIRYRRYAVAVLATALLFFATLITGEHQSISASNAVNLRSDAGNATASNGTNSSTPTPVPMACTRDAFPCPDGHLVYRDPFNNCSFAKCEETAHETTPVHPESGDGSGSGSYDDSQHESDDASQSASHENEDASLSGSRESEDASLSGSQIAEDALQGDFIIWTAITNSSSDDVQNATIYALQEWAELCNASFDFNVTGNNNVSSSLTKYDLEVNVSCLPYGEVSLHILVDVNTTSGDWWVQQCYHGSTNLLQVVNESAVVCGNPFSDDDKDDDNEDDDDDSDSVNVSAASSESHDPLFSGIGGTVLLVVSVIGMVVVAVAAFVVGKGIRRSRANRDDTSVLSDDVEAAVHEETTASEQPAATDCETDSEAIDAAGLMKETKSTRGEEGAFMNTPKV